MCLERTWFVLIEMLMLIYLDTLGARLGKKVPELTENDARQKYFKMKYITKQHEEVLMQTLLPGGARRGTFAASRAGGG